MGVGPLSVFLHDRALVVRSGLVAGALLLALVGCGALMPGAVTEDKSVASGDSVKVVFVGVDLRAVAELTGFQVADAGDPEAQVEALEDWVNANGGIGGRDLDAVFRLYDAQADSPAAEEQLCNQLTQDDKAFAVVITGQFQTNARPCYADRGTLVLDATLVATDDTAYGELAPYLWSPSYPEYTGFVKALVSTLVGQAFFEGRDDVGVVAADTPINRRVMDDLAVPLLKENGIKAEVAWVDTTDTGSLFTGSEQAAVTFRGKKIDRVMFLGGARLASIFATSATTQGLTARYAISSFDNPQFFVNNPETIKPETMNGMVGVGFNPSQDVPDDQYAFPSGQAEKECLEIYSAAGITFESREAARVALPYCDAARLFKAASAEVDGDLDAEKWTEAARGLTDFATATGFGKLTEGSHAVASAYRVLRFDQDCGCFVYEGEEIPFE